MISIELALFLGLVFVAGIAIEGWRASKRDKKDDEGQGGQ